MPIATTAGVAEPQAGAAAQPQEGASQAQVADAQSSQADGADNASGTEDVVQLREALAAANREAAKHRNELKKLQDAQRAADEAKLSDAERSANRLKELEAENATLRTHLQSQVSRSAVTTVAQRLGFIDPSDAYPMIASSLEYDESGEPKHVERLLNDLARTKPHLIRKPSGAGSGEGGVRGTVQQGQSNWLSDAIRRRQQGG